MKRYTVGLVRERFAEALDAADQGIAVVIERRGVRYSLTREATRSSRGAGRRTRLFQRVDPAILDGTWSWDWTPAGLEFQPRPGK